MSFILLLFCEITRGYTEKVNKRSKNNSCRHMESTRNLKIGYAAISTFNISYNKCSAGRTCKDLDVKVSHVVLMHICLIIYNS